MGGHPKTGRQRVQTVAGVAARGCSGLAVEQIRRQHRGMRGLLAVSLLFIPCAARAGWEQLPPLPEPRGVAAPFAGVSGEALIVAGGANFPDKMPWEGGRKVWHDKVWVLEKPDGTWREAGKLPRPLAYGVSVSVTGAVVCIGGSDAERHYGDVILLVWQGGKLETQPRAIPGPLPVPLANAAGAVDVKENVYVACGSTGPGEKRSSNRVFRAGWRAKVLEWRELPPLPAEPRILPVAAASGEVFYLFGGAALEAKDGKTVRRCLRDAWSYTEADGWKRLADMPKPVVAAPSPAPVTGGKVLLISGDDGSLAGFMPEENHPGFPKTILSYNVAANTWTGAGEVPAPRATVPCVPWRGQFVIPGGEVRPGVRSPEVWSFNPESDKK